MARKRTSHWLHRKSIDFEPSAQNTRDQNGVAERSGGVIMKKSRAMRISARLPHNLWREMVNCAVYLNNQTPRESQGWKTPYEVFFSALPPSIDASIQKKPQLAHLRAYGCRAYAMTKEAQLKKKKELKLDPHAHIGYLIRSYGGDDSRNG